MAGYSARQSTYTTGDVISAADTNDEFNQLLAGFHATTGHTHDGTAGDGGPVSVLRDTNAYNKILLDASNNHLEFYVNVSSSAVQQLRIQDGAIVPITDNDIDLGTSSLEFKDLYVDGTAYVDAINYNGTAIASTAAELNIVDGDTSATSTTVADADRVVLNDGGTMKQVAVTDLAAYFDDEITAMPNLVTTAATTVGALNSGSITSGFGTIDTGSSTITTTGLITGGSLDIDDVLINGSNIGHTDDTDLLTLANGLLTVAGEISVTTLDIGGTNVTSTAAELNLLDGVSGLVQADFTKLAAVDSTAAELNIVDGDTSATSTTLADADRVVVNDNGTMVQVALTDFETYFESALDTLSNVTTVGALNSGSITSGFGSIDNGSSAITTTGTITYGSLSDGSITVTAFVDEDNMASDSATLIPTQQSVKAYVDSQVATANELSELTDVNITSAADGALLFYDTGTSKWIDNVVSGDITIADTGVAAIGTGVIVNADINSSAAIDATKIHDGTISNTEFGYLNGVTSAIQTQLNAKAGAGFAVAMAIAL